MARKKSGKKRTISPEATTNHFDPDASMAYFQR